MQLSEISIRSQGSNRLEQLEPFERRLPAQGLVPWFFWNRSRLDTFELFINLAMHFELCNRALGSSTVSKLLATQL
jgi:hypothetical protein